MPMMLVAALMMVQAPATTQPLTAQAAKAKKQKAPQVCEDIEITGSRSKRHVCHDANVDAGTLLGVSHNLGGKGSSQSISNGTSSAGSLPPG